MIIGGREDEIDATLAALRAAWLANPELRLGQLMVVAVGNHVESGRLFYRTDERIRDDLAAMTGDAQP